VKLVYSSFYPSCLHSPPSDNCLPCQESKVNKFVCHNGWYKILIPSIHQSFKHQTFTFTCSGIINFTSSHMRRLKGLGFMNKGFWNGTNQYCFCICSKRDSRRASTVVRSNPCLSWAGCTKLASNTPRTHNDKKVDQQNMTDLMSPIVVAITLLCRRSCNWNLSVMNRRPHGWLSSLYTKARWESSPITPRPSLPVQFQIFQNGCRNPRDN